MFSMFTVLFSLSTNGFAGPIEQCNVQAETWLTQLKTNGCTVGPAFEKGASAGCTAIPEDGWKREQRAARRAIYQGCEPNVHGLGVPTTNEQPNDENATCGEHILIMRGETPESPPPTSPTMGVDQMMGIMGAAVWTCFDPKSLELCRSTSSIETSPSDLQSKREACISLTSPPLDPTVISLALESGVMPIIPKEQLELLDSLILAQKNNRLARLKEKTIFQQAQVDEVRRAHRFKKTCLSAPEELETLEKIESIRTECIELKALWRGEDTTRLQLEKDGTIATRFQEKMRGRCLNTDSLGVSDPAQIDAQLAALLEQTKSLVVIRFMELIQTDWAAAEALLDAHRSHMDPGWVKDAVDQIIEAGG